MYALYICYIKLIECVIVINIRKQGSDMMIFLTTNVKKTVRGLFYMPRQLVRYELKEFILFIDENEVIHDVHIFEYRTTIESEDQQKEVGQTYLSYVKEKDLHELPYAQQKDIQSGVCEWSTPIDFSTVKNIEIFLDGDLSKLMRVPVLLDELI